MNKIESKFIKSNIKKAIWNLECANRIIEGTIDKEIIEELKTQLLLITIKEQRNGKS